MTNLSNKQINKKNWIILKLGGSLLSTLEHNFNSEFTWNFLNFLNKDLSDFNFIIVNGGGNINEIYLKSLNSFLDSKDNKLQLLQSDLYYFQNQIGISCLTLNAYSLLYIASRIYSKSSIYADVIKYSDYQNILKNKNFYTKFKNYKLIIAGAEKPGFSSDYNAYQIAKIFKTKQIISLKNVDGVYDQDPTKNKNAKLITNLTWQNYKDILGDTKFIPRSHLPIDVKTTQYLSKHNFCYSIINGNNLPNFKNCILQKEFVGSLIKD